MLTADDYRAHDALGLAALVRAGEVTAAEVTEAALAQIDRLNPALNAVILRDDTQARAAARAVPSGAPFTGVPFLAKDINVQVRGWPLTHACRFFDGADSATADSALARRWRAAGLAVIGRSNTPEFATDFACEPELYGPTLNPWDKARTPGGSSGGAAAAVAAGMVPMAHASDSGGSIRVPAACCGLFGFKPTSGRVATGSPLGPLVGGLNCDHVLSRSVRDSAAMLDATAAPETGTPCPLAAPPAGGYLAALVQPPPPLRIGLCAAAATGQHPEAEIAELLTRTGQLLESLGHHVAPFDWPGHIDAAEAAAPLWASEIALLVEQRSQALGRAPQNDELGPIVRFGLEAAARLTMTDAARLRRTRWDIRRRVAEVMAPFDILLSPVTATPPPASGLLGDAARRGVDDWGDLAEAFAPYTEIFNLTGQPAMSVPLHQGADGLPVGMQLAARVGEDALLLRLARQLEQAAPWAQRRPPTAA
ncbi:amidase [Salinihabitans flavidus]|uniref:Amidase n=1 Tax=Salinihabitans flavidus TaxID=569882 RepID=A0A1H8MSU7_9RHOB|nr:amidase [Salinihabitans flavidus]SEO20236.1 amidase [Salinihabitans flavidus]